jgi:probable addiction module antidote protein
VGPGNTSNGPTAYKAGSCGLFFNLAHPGLNRESLYKALGNTGNPEFSTVMRIVRATGLTL